MSWLNKEKIADEISKVLSNEPEKQEELKTEIMETLEEDGARYEDRGNAAKFKADGEEYNLIEDEEEAERIALEMVEEQLDDDPMTYFGQDSLKHYMYVTDTDVRIMADEEADSYVDGVDEETLVKDADMWDEYDAADDKYLSDDEAESAAGEKEKEEIVEKAKEAARDKKYEEVKKALDKDPVGYFEDTYGKELVKSMIEKGYLNIKKEEAAKDFVNESGWASYLSVYDGEYKETESGYIFFR